MVLATKIFVLEKLLASKTLHYVKCVQARSFFWSIFSRIRTEYGPEKTPYLDTFHVVLLIDYYLLLKKKATIKYIVSKRNFKRISKTSFSDKEIFKHTKDFAVLCCQPLLH